MGHDRKAPAITPALRNEIRRLILEQHSNIENFARVTGIPKSTLSRVVTGERSDCRVSTLVAIAKGLRRKLTVKFD